MAYALTVKIKQLATKTQIDRPIWDFGLTVWGGRGTSITLSFGIKTFDGVVKSPPSTDAGVPPAYPTTVLKIFDYRRTQAPDASFRGKSKILKSYNRAIAQSKINNQQAPSFKEETIQNPKFKIQNQDDSLEP